MSYPAKEQPCEGASDTRDTVPIERCTFVYRSFNGLASNVGRGFVSSTDNQPPPVCAALDHNIVSNINGKGERSVDPSVA